MIHSGVPTLTNKKHKPDVLKYFIFFLDLIKEKKLDNYLNYKN
jgi:hypothetical protein